MALDEKINADLKAAMKSGDDVAKQTLRMIKSELMLKSVEVKRPLDEAEEIAVLMTAVKTRKDSIAEYEKGGRADLADAERAQIEVVQRYLPKAMGESEARAAISAMAKELGVSSKKEMGKLIKAVMERYRGQIEGKEVSRLAAEILG
jgi:uncharacterized protein YqeY